MQWYVTSLGITEAVAVTRTCERGLALSVAAHGLHHVDLLPAELAQLLHLHSTVITAAGAREAHSPFAMMSATGDRLQAYDDDKW